MVLERDGEELWACYWMRSHALAIVPSLISVVFAIGAREDCVSSDVYGPSSASVHD